MSDRPRDSLWSRVRNAETEFGLNYPAIQFSEQKQLCARIVKSAWWKKRRPDITNFSVQHTGRTSNYCTTNIGHGTNMAVAVLDIGSPDCNAADVLHAVAHYLHPGDTAWHGPEYAKAMLDIVGKYLGLDERRRLSELYRKHKVKTVVWSQDAKDRAKTRFAERDLKALLAELKPSGEAVTPPS